MKRILAAVLAVVTLSLSAQEGPKISSAIIAMRGGEMVEAKQLIDEATEIIDGKNKSDISEKVMSKFYYNKALIYKMIAASEDEALRASAPNANDIAAQSAIDLLLYESKQKKQRNSEKMIQEIPMLAYNYLVAAGQAYDAGDLQGAYDGYMAAYELKKNEALGEFAELDTNLLFNGAILAGQMGDHEASIDGFKQCLEMGYTGITYVATYTANGQPRQYPNKKAMERDIELGLASDPVISEDVTPSIYVSLLNNYKKMGDDENYQATLATARELYPEDKDLLDMQLQVFLDKQDYAGAMANLDEAIEKNPGKAIYHLVKGNILQNQMSQDDAALIEYQAALDLEPENSDTWYMAGAIFYERAADVIEEMNSLGLNETKKYNQLKEKQKQIFQEALPYFEKALELSPEDTDVIRALMEVYRKIGDYEKSQAMSTRLAELTAE